MATQNSYKVVVVGSSGVGKTAIVQRLVDGTFQEESQSTVGVEFKSHNITNDNEIVKLNIWDTAGQERFRSVSKAYFRNAVGAILVFACNDSGSFADLDSWLNDLHTLSTSNAVVVLVGNKSDLAEGRQVSVAEAETFAARHGMIYLETSARDGTNVSEAFVRLAKQISERVKKGEIQGQFTAPSAPPIGISRPNIGKNDGNGCKC